MGIPRSRLHLACTGRPLPVRDGHRRFLVHPFLMDLAAGGGESSSGNGGSGGGAPTAGAAGAAPVGAGDKAASAAMGGAADFGEPQVVLNWENTEARWVLPRCDGNERGHCVGRLGASALRMLAVALQTLLCPACVSCQLPSPCKTLCPHSSLAQASDRRLPHGSNACSAHYACSELGSLPHVPLLLETLRRLVLPRYMAVHVEHLRRDRVHGAAELADYTVQVRRFVMPLWCDPLQAGLRSFSARL